MRIYDEPYMKGVSYIQLISIKCDGCICTSRTIALHDMTLRIILFKNIYRNNRYMGTEIKQMSYLLPG